MPPVQTDRWARGAHICAWQMAFEAKLMAMGRQAQPASHQMRPCRRLDVRQWGQGRIEATPHGYFAKFVDGNGGARVPSKINESNLVLDHYNISHDPVDLARDFPAGGKHVGAPNASCRRCIHPPFADRPAAFEGGHASVGLTRTSAS